MGSELASEEADGITQSEAESDGKDFIINIFHNTNKSTVVQYR